MEHDDLERAQRMRYQMGLLPLAENAAPLGFTNLLKEKLPVRSLWESTATEGCMADGFRKAWDEHFDRKLAEEFLKKEQREGMSAEMAQWIKGQWTNAGTPPVSFDKENIRTLAEQMEWIREREVQRMMYSHTYIRVVESAHITKEVQARRHRKKRIDKKWRKRYGMKRVPI